MNYTRIDVKNGKFYSHNNNMVFAFSSNSVTANDWICKIDKSGSIFCECKISDKKGQRTVELLIKDGVSILKKDSRVVHICTLKKGIVNGTIFLGGGKTADEKMAYFRNSEFQEFMDEHGINSVIYQNPNDLHVERKYRKQTTYMKQIIVTDGDKKLLKENFTMTESKRFYKVKNSTWVIKITIGSKGRKCSIYTLSPIREIANLPKKEELDALI